MRKQVKYNNSIINAVVIYERDVLVYKYHRCKCPCNKRTPYRKSHKKTGIPRYIYGHQSRVYGFKKGKENLMYGKHHTDKFKMEQSKRMSGENNVMFDIHLSGSKHWNYGNKNPEQSVRMKDNNPMFDEKSILKGIKTRRKQWKQEGHPLLGTKRPDLSKSMQCENNKMWKGDDVGYNCLHKWIKRHKHKSKLCECCGKKKPLEIANISGKYKRNVKDYEWLCRKCHMTKDGRMNNLNYNHGE